jgi:putative ABC transport system permease protein
MKRIGAWRFRKTWEKELNDELRFHLEKLMALKISAGIPPDEARRQAAQEFGGMEAVKEDCREQRRGFWLEILWGDVRYGLRLLRKNPAFAIIAIVTLAVGIGMTSAVFSFVDRNLFRSLPYPNDDRLVSFGLLAPIEKNEFLLGRSYVDWRKAPGPFEAMTSMIPGVVDCDITEQNPVRLSCAQVEQNFLSTLGVQPIVGRNFLPDEDRPGASSVALISYGLWKNRFGGNPDIVSKTIPLDGQPTAIAGVLPANFEMPNLLSPDILVPQALDEAAQRKSDSGAVLRGFARLKPGINVAQAAAAIQPWFEEALQQAPPQFRNEVHLSVRTLRDRQVQDLRLAFWVLLGAVLAVLLVACANVASLLLARATSRERELAVRAALGASRIRLIRQALTESLMLGILGGAGGCWIAYMLMHLFVSIAPAGIPRLQQATLDLRVILFTAGISLLCGIVFGLAPAMRMPSPEFLAGKETRLASRNPLRQVLVASQIAISLVLLTGAGLLLRSLWNLQSVPIGIQAQNIVTEQISLGQSRYPNASQQMEFFDHFLARLQTFPGVTSLALSDSIPPSGAMHATVYAGIEIEGRPRFAEGTGGMVAWRAVTPGYFSALGIPILGGRAFDEADRIPSQHSIILSDFLARKLFPNENPLGKPMRFGLTGPWRTVVGVVADVKNAGLDAQSDPEFYIPWKNEPPQYLGSAFLIARTPLNPQTVEKWMHSETASLDPTLPVKIETMNQRVWKLAARPRFNAVLLSIFAAMGVLLAAIGIYGVVGFLVTRETREIGVRMALGATPGAICKMVMANVARWTLAGTLLGLLGSWFVSQFLRSLLFQVPPRDPWSIGAAGAVLLVVAFLAAWIPARRAMRVDPIVALRYE